uniref:NADH dehydrogenase subunit 4L n=1 Tax=Pycnoscelus surinamensis TaxID=36961 RepID=UPI00257EFC9F|nr:NADH dehydrogenase subunit 4L [Pycnoscelus surinamensis]WGW15113.1 NADH dehydrogenase subunit 4L [Pycnoscelus surinamensis]
MMIYLYINISFFCGIWVFSSNRKHLLATLLSLEFIVLTLYFVLYYYLTSFNFELFFSMVFLTFSVCEGALGLSILVSMIRSYGSDFFSAYSMLQC